jgi:hypothetical protein
MRNPVLLPLAFAAFLTTLVGQSSSPTPVCPREQFGSLLLDPGSWPERIEVRGRILLVADFIAAAREQGVAADDVARTVLDNLLLAVLTEELQHQKTWLSDADYDEAYAAYASPYDTTPFTVEVVATRLNGYPDLATFQRRWRVLQSFVRANKLDDPPLAELQAEAKLSHDLLTGAAVEAEIWIHEAPLAADGRRNFAAARTAALQSLDLLAAGKDTTKLPEGARYLRFPCERGLAMHDQLRRALGEAEYISLHQDLVADAVFDAEPGKLLGPMRSGTGVLIARVLYRQHGNDKFDVDNPQSKDLLQTLLAHRRFLAWVDQVLAHTGIRIDGRLLTTSPAAGTRSTDKAK